MKFVLFLFAVGLVRSAFPSPIPKAIYGDDNRIDLSSHSDATVVELGKSVAGIAKNHLLAATEDGYSFKQMRLGLCEGQSFREQFTLPFCSAFLIAPNVLLTAGHCVDEENFCANNKIVFDFDISAADAGKLSQKQVFECESVLAYKNERLIDYGIIILKESISDRPSLLLRRSGMITESEELFVIGHPSGLPMKYADDGYVSYNFIDTFFKTDLDTFAGNSGSPVFNKATGVVEGILTRGDEDYEIDRYKSCLRVNSCYQVGDYGCSGESATRVTAINELKKILGE